MEGRKQKAREGKWNGGFAPYGYKLVDGKLEIAEEEAEVIKLIYDKFVHTNMGAATIARYLNDHGYKKIQRQNGTLDTFSAHFIKIVLDNPVYCGKLAYGRRKNEKINGTRNQYHKVMDEKAIEEFEASRKKDTIAIDEISFGGQKVLLVEDNEMNREIATEILEEVGLVIDTAEDGAIAVRKVMENGPSYYDFILMDIQMPVMDGYEATAEIRKMADADKLPIIALSANAFKEDMDRSIAAGMNAHVAKPIDVKTLFETMKGLEK